MCQSVYRTLWLFLNLVDVFGAQVMQAVYVRSKAVTRIFPRGGVQPYPARGSGGVLWVPPVGSWAEPQPRSNLVHFSLKIWHLMATSLIIFLRINWPNLVKFEHSENMKSCSMGLLCRFVRQYRLEAEGNLLKLKWKPKNCLVMITDRQSSLSLTCTLCCHWLLVLTSIDKQKKLRTGRVIHKVHIEIRIRLFTLVQIQQIWLKSNQTSQYVNGSKFQVPMWGRVASATP